MQTSVPIHASCVRKPSIESKNTKLSPIQVLFTEHLIGIFLIAILRLIVLLTTALCPIPSGRLGLPKRALRALLPKRDARTSVLAGDVKIEGRSVAQSLSHCVQCLSRLPHI